MWMVGLATEITYVCLCRVLLHSTMSRFHTGRPSFHEITGFKMKKDVRAFSNHDQCSSQIQEQAYLDLTECSSLACAT
jgi:hypothetical protein